ncbi:sentrin-specific protease 2-like [Psammomys obesus]|uniref:sentrin-specific protease 2-like n=1 Tax=Psammomys obesus TaxID=48139 RepID=UPI0024529E29|nr:sentrin-specific protease 2-like [Psammomys obesus]
MSGVDKTPPRRLSDPPAIKRTTQELPPSVRPARTLMWRSESCGTADSRHRSKGSPTRPSRQQRGTIGHEHPGKGRNRKCQEERGNDVHSEEPAQPRKRLTQEQREIALGCEEPGQSQIWKPQEEAQLQLKAPECAEGPEQEPVTEGTSVDGGQRRQRAHCSVDEGVQKRHNEKYPGLLGRLQPAVHVSPGPHSAHVSTMDTLKNVKGCVERQSYRAEPAQFEPEQPAGAVTRDKSPGKSERRSPEEKMCDTEKVVGVNLDADRRGRHLQPDSLRGAQTQSCTDSVSNGILNNKMSTPEAAEKALEDQEKGRGLDHGPDVTEDMEKEIRSALGPGPQDEILSCAFKLQITREDLWTLKNTQWLNDKIINFYMNLLMERNQNQGYPALHAFNTFFYTKLKFGGYRSVKRWTRAVNLFAKELILVPVHLDVHWSLVVTDLRKKSIVYLDSMGQKRPDILELIFCYLQDESKARRNRDLSPSEWKQYSMPAEEIPQQLNGGDCGVFTCKYADYISRGQPITFSQQHMPLFRKKMVWEILHKRLL